MKTLLTPTPLIAIEISDATLEYTLPKGTDNELLVLGEEGTMTIKFKDVKFDSILGTVDKGVIDFETDDLVQESIDLPEYKYGGELHPKETWWNYEYDWYNLSSAVESFISLLESHSLSVDKKYLIIKPKN